MNLTIATIIINNNNNNNNINNNNFNNNNNNLTCFGSVDESNFDEKDDADDDEEAEEKGKHNHYDDQQLIHGLTFQSVGLKRLNYNLKLLFCKYAYLKETQNKNFLRILIYCFFLKVERNVFL